MEQQKGFFSLPSLQCAIFFPPVFSSSIHFTLHVGFTFSYFYLRWIIRLFGCFQFSSRNTRIGSWTPPLDISWSQNRQRQIWHAKAKQTRTNFPRTRKIIWSILQSWTKILRQICICGSFSQLKQTVARKCNFTCSASPHEPKCWTRLLKLISLEVQYCIGWRRGQEPKIFFLLTFSLFWDFWTDGKMKTRPWAEKLRLTSGKIGNPVVTS